MIKVCKKCNAANNLDAKFCAKCGANLSENTNVVPSVEILLQVVGIFVINVVIL